MLVGAYKPKFEAYDNYSVELWLLWRYPNRRRYSDGVFKNDILENND